jgi:CubicO group peptidase (beta-lactamase class C family)
MGFMSVPNRLILIAGSALAGALFAAGCARGAATAPADAGTPGPPPPALPLPAPDRSAFIAAVDGLAADGLERGPIAGLSIAVFEHGLPILAKGYGFADLESGVPATPETSYPIASITKRFTAALILRLADQGQLSLDDPLRHFFPAARAKIGALTLRHLLDHTSGLTRSGPAPRAAAQNVLARGGTAHAQGDAWDYSNYNFSLLGLVIEKVSGRDYAACVHDDLVVPLGLSGTGYCEDGSAVPGRGRDYISGRNRVTPTAYWTKPRFFASGGLCSTVLDLVRWERALESGRVLSPALRDAMRTPTRLPGSLDADYGLGTRMGWTAGHRKIGHTGGGQGNKAVIARYPDDDVTIAVLLNTERPNAPVTANELEERVARLFFGVPEAGALEPAPLEDGQRYAGAYRVGRRNASVALDAGALTMHPGFHHRTDSRLVAAGGGVFFAEEDPSIELRFQVRDDQTRGFSRYRNGWFAGLAVRSEGVP